MTNKSQTLIDLNKAMAIISSQEEKIKNLAYQVQNLQIQLERALKGWLGQKSEKIDPQLLNSLQLNLFEDSDSLMAQFQQERKNENVDEVEIITYERNKSHQSSLKEFPTHIEIEVIDHKVADLSCIKCTDKGQKGTLVESCYETVKRLEYIPASIKVEEHRRYKYQCNYCQTYVRSPKPMWLIDKGKAGEGLLAHVITSKFCDHMPYYRIAKQFERSKIYIPETDMMNWTHAVAEQIKPLYDLMCEKVLLSRIIHSDDTTVPVRDLKNKKMKTGRAWIYCGDEKNPYTVYQYTPNRKSIGPIEFLKSFKGYLQADGYKGYDALYRTGDVVEVSCMAHARRYFNDRINYDKEKVNIALKYIQELYKVEKEIKEFTKEEKEKHRQEISKLILEKFGKWLETTKQVLLPKDPLQEAITYTLNHWQQLQVYLEDGDLDIDNNEAERGMRCVALGRKNWLFVGNDRAGHTAAILYSFVTTCKDLKINTYEYLRDIFKRLPSIPQSKLHELLPDNWAKSQ